MATVAEMNLAEHLETKEDNIKTIGAGGRLTVLNQCRQDLLRWGGCLIRALAFVHSHRIRHRDIKPANILVKDGHVLISNFGLSKHFAEDVTTMTITDPNPCGTPRYWAPEVASEWPDRLPRTRLSDVWSMGCVLLELATMMENGFITEYRRLPLRYCARADDVLQRIAANQWSSRIGFDFLCFVMLNPRAEYRLRSNELAMVVETMQVPSCKQRDCRVPKDIASRQFKTAIDSLETISRKRLHKWDYINNCISKSTDLKNFLHSKDPSRNIEPSNSASTAWIPTNTEADLRFQPEHMDITSAIAGLALLEEDTPEIQVSEAKAEYTDSPPRERKVENLATKASALVSGRFTRSIYTLPVLSAVGLGISFFLATLFHETLKPFVFNIFGPDSPLGLNRKD